MHIIVRSGHKTNTDRTKKKGARSIDQIQKSNNKATKPYLYYWTPFATVFHDAISDFETLFGEKADDYIGEFEVAMEEALCSDVRADCPNRNASKSQKRWKTVASEFISASSETREKMRMSWNLKGIMNQMHLKLSRHKGMEDDASG